MSMYCTGSFFSLSISKKVRSSSFLSLFLGLDKFVFLVSLSGRKKKGREEIRSTTADRLIFLCFQTRSKGNAAAAAAKEELSRKEGEKSLDCKGRSEDAAATEMDGEACFLLLVEKVVKMERKKARAPNYEKRKQKCIHR